MPSLFLRVKGVIELALITFLHPVREFLDHRHVVLDHLAESRSCPQTVVTYVRVPLTWVMLDVVAVMVFFLRLRAEL